MPVAKGRTGTGYAANAWSQRAWRTSCSASASCRRCARRAAAKLNSSSRPAVQQAYHFDLNQVFQQKLALKSVLRQTTDRFDPQPVALFRR
jgi:DNA replication protein DnaC